MRVIVPGGYYSYDSAGKKIWLDYQYYGTTLENIERVKNLTRNKVLYDSKRSTVLPTVENGCITHSYSGTEADADKIQVTLKTPITNSLTELTPVDGVVTLSTDGKVLVLPTEDAAILPSYNDRVLDPNRLTIAESPFGGLKGSGSPDYAPGTVNIVEGDGVYLQDVNGQNSSKTLSAGKLKELNLMSVDTVNHAITEEFIVRNDSAGTDVLVIDACDSTTGWTASITGTVSEFLVENGRVMVTGTTDSIGRLFVYKEVTVANLSSLYFYLFTIECDQNSTMYTSIGSDTANRVYWSGLKTSNTIVAGNNTKFVLPLKAPVSASPMNANPEHVNGTPDWGHVTLCRFGVQNLTPNSSVTFYIGNITACDGTWAQVEVAVPDNLSATSLSLYTHNGTAYQLCSTHSLDGAYSQVSQTSANCTFLDGTKLDDVYEAAGAGIAVFPKGSAAETKNGSTGSITYSENRGTDKRIGLTVNLPPSDGGRTNLNQIRLKTILTYAPDAEDNYSASYDFADTTNTSYGLQNLSKPWIALYDPANSLIDFYLFTHRPQNLSFKRDETGTIYSLSLYPGAGSVYHGQIPFADLTLDTNSDSVPDCLEAAVNGSVTKFLANYSMVI